jgi:hypothetical protein
MSATIPRFLLPRQGAIWRTPAVRNFGTTTRRSAAASKPSKPLVLEKPTKFNPPSHPSRLRKPRPQYPGPQLSAEEIARQSAKKYPNMMPPEGTFMHWFLTNRSIHIYITLGTLFSMAGFTWLTNFKRTSKFADMLPNASDLFFHPIQWTRTVIEVLRLHTAAVAAESQERRKQKVDDVQKRAEYRKAHGLETEAFGGWTAKTDAENMGPAMNTDGRVPNVVDDASPIAMEPQGGDVAQQQKKPLKKWLGIW